ncbi:MAG: hypothetical protein AAF449_09210, partial [Myxococcota bacterium]
LLRSAPAGAQEETSPKIELKSPRIDEIDGPKFGEQPKSKQAPSIPKDRAPPKIPPPGHPKRLTYLRDRAQKDLSDRAYQQACRHYDLIADEVGIDAIAADPEERQNAARAYLSCARLAHRAVKLKKAEQWLVRSEHFGPRTPRHVALRRKMHRDTYRKKMVNGDVEGALQLFNEAQQRHPDEDERIWMGDQLASMAWEAHKNGDKTTTRALLRRLEAVAPMNPEYRRLKSVLDEQAGVFGRIAQVIAAVIALVIGLNLLAAWREYSRLSIKKNRYEVD